MTTKQSDRTRDRSARVLLAEDDPSSRFFLTEALRGLGYRVEACTEGTRALALARASCFDVLLLDCRMPGAGAVDILSGLRADSASRSHGSAAVATSADVDELLRQRLLATGFSDVLGKPISVATLEAALRRVLPDDGCRGAGGTVLDDEAALSSAGTMQTVVALRTLFRDELLVLDDELDTLCRQPDSLGERLHRLRAACGLCGALDLSRHSRQLSRAVITTGKVDETDLQQFRRALTRTLQAL